MEKNKKYNLQNLNLQNFYKTDTVYGTEENVIYKRGENLFCKTRTIYKRNDLIVRKERILYKIVRKTVDFS